MTDSQPPGRREFIKKAGAAGILSVGLSAIAREALGHPAPPGITLNTNDVILFQGDSITDAGRDRDAKAANNTKGLGNGYALLATAELLKVHAEKNLQVLNRGISGNKVYQLADRWEDDCLQLKPAVISILIGVNDFWHMINGKYDGTVDTYRNDFLALLERTRQSLPGSKFVIGEPFAVKGTSAVNDSWFPAFSEYQKAAREMSEKFSAIWIPYQRVFESAVRKAPAVYWTHDGVHPSLAGSQLMAAAWLQAVTGAKAK